jgi:glyoxylase I family protein
MVASTFSHVAISCRDPRAVERFYSSYFNYQRARVVPLGDDQIVFLKNGDNYLELFSAQGESPAPPAGKDGPAYPGWRHLAFHVADVDAKLAEMGKDASISLGPFNFDEIIKGWRSVWIADPEGNIVEISQGFVDQDNPPQF